MIGYAARYGHQPLISLLGEVTVPRLSRFCDAVQYWIKIEQSNGSSAYNSIAEGGG